MSKPFSLFTNDDYNSRIMKQILANYDQEQKDLPPRPVSGNPAPKRPSSANPVKRRGRSASGSKYPSKLKAAVNQSSKENENLHSSRENLAIDNFDLKKKILLLEEQVNFLKSDNHRLEIENNKQQKHIEQLMHISDGISNPINNKNSSTNAGSVQLRKEIEKSILVRQLKIQLNSLRNIISEKEHEIDVLRKEVRASYIHEVEMERDEYLQEVQRLRKTLDSLKDELNREKQRREWNNKLAGETGEDLRKELARLASGYQNILTNLSGKSPSRPATAGAVRTSGTTDPRTQRYEPNKEIVSNISNNPTSGLSKEWIQELTEEPVKQHPTPAVANIPVPLAKALNTQPVIEHNPTHANHQQLHQSQPNQIREFQIGQKVEGHYKGMGSWYSGKIKSHDPNDLYTLEYDDGDLEANVIAANIRAAPTPNTVSTQPISSQSSVSSTPAIPSSANKSPSVHKIGDKIEALYYNGSTWYKGVIKGVVYNDQKGSFLYDVLYEDGDREKQVLEVNIRIPGSNSVSEIATLSSKANSVKTEEITIKEEDKKPVPLINTPEVIPVAKEIETTDEKRKNDVSPRVEENVVVSQTVKPIEKSPRVEPLNLSDLNKPSVQPINNNSEVVIPFIVGNKVEGYYQGSAWYPAEVKAVYVEGQEALFDLIYEDGDEEKRVPAKNIKLRSPRPSEIADTSLVQSKKYKIGDRVEVFFDEYNAWYGGNVIHMNDDGTFVIDYDDGDREAKVPAIRMRSILTGIPNLPSLVYKFEIGEVIEARFEGHEYWFPGKIQSKGDWNNKPVYGIQYDDGDFEDNVIEEFVRYIQVKEKKKPASNQVSPRPPVVITPAAPSEPEVPSIASKEPYSNKEIDTSNTLTTATQDIPAPTPQPATIVTEEPAVTHPHPPKHQISSTNLDAFLNDLSDDDDGDLDLAAIGALDGGRVVTLSGKTETAYSSTSKDNDDEYNEDFDA